MEYLTLRPHHILDIVASVGAGTPFVPAETGNGVHTVAEILLSGQHPPIRLVAGADDICKPCRLLEDGVRCSNMLRQVEPNLSMQDYNDGLDRKLLVYMRMREGEETTFAAFLSAVARNLAGVAAICTHPGEEEAAKLGKLETGLEKLGISGIE